ncbi:hypothetical protein G7046_g6420 [Stylonectria norvegica]|nr:hypothetical protein G7046_g6420 [Stylonectria norvegica]
MYNTYVRVSRPFTAAGNYVWESVIPERVQKRRFDPNYKLKIYQKLAAERQFSAADKPGASEWYRYEPVQKRQIRLLTLRPGLEIDELRCSLSAHSLDAEPSLVYEALSYTWGDPTHVNYITCDGKLIQITRNLSRALQRLRHETDDRVLWIDAVSINQGDIVERGLQVQLMSDIYRTAGSVIVWLGDSSQNSPAAFRLMHQLHAAAMKTAETDRDTPIIESELEKLGLPERKSPDWTAIDTIYWRPWFTRAWIIQEVSFAKEAIIWCGEDSISWTDFAIVADYIYRRRFPRLTDLDATTVLPLNNVVTQLQIGTKQDMLYLLASFRRSFATNPVDKVYALVGLASDAKIVPDYTIPVENVYRDVTKDLLVKSLAVLSLVGEPSWKTLEDLPSWVPDWSCFLREYPFLFAGLGYVFRAGGNTSIQVTWSSNGKVLSSPGVLLDHVRVTGYQYTIAKSDPGRRLARVIGKSIIEDTINATTTRNLRTWEQIVLDLRTYPTGEDIESVLHKTFVAGADVTIASPSGASMAELYAAFRRHEIAFPGESKKPGRFTMDESRVNSSVYQLDMHRAAYGRRILTTVGGYVGLGPKSTVAGDSVVLLSGGATAYILREDRKTSSYKFIGEAYIHGMMNGEAFEGDPVLQQFDIV